MTIAVMIIVETLLAQRVVQDVASFGTTIGIIMHGSGMALVGTAIGIMHLAECCVFPRTTRSSSL